MQLLEGKFESSTEKKESFESIDHRGNKIVTPKPKYVGNSSRYYEESQKHLIDSSSGTNYLNDSYGSGKSFPRNNSRRQTPEYTTGKIVYNLF